ncbi:MAG: hypothetical protein KDB06_00545, partial [Ilumatobacter sp.]|nr:hypothetical protein [Ilumatobacter sp.]
MGQALRGGGHGLAAAEVEEGVGGEEGRGSGQRRGQRTDRHLLQLAQHRRAVVSGIGDERRGQVSQPGCSGATAGPQFHHAGQGRLHAAAVALQVGDEHLLAEHGHFQVAVAGGAGRRLSPLEKRHHHSGGRALQPAGVGGDQGGHGQVEDVGGQVAQPLPQHRRWRWNRRQRHPPEDVQHHGLVAVGKREGAGQVAAV